MNRKLARLFQPSFQLYFVCLVLFALISAFFSIPLAVVELAAILALAVYSRQHTNRCRREIARRHPGLASERPDIEQIMLFFTRRPSA